MSDHYDLDRPIICPYDKNHKIAPSRIQRHLVKCAKNFPPNYKVTCPYNATHRLFQSEIQEHIFNCRDQQHVDPIIYEMHRSRGATMSSVASETRSVIECQESWDEDGDHFYPIPFPTDYKSYALGSAGETNFVHSSQSLELCKPIPTGPNRPPCGLAEALMIEQSGESTVEDIESVVSFMGIGRGKLWNAPRNEMAIKIGKARGSAQAKGDI